MNPKKVGSDKSEILVVEDSATQREQIQHLLENQGFNVRAASDGKQALEIIRKHPPTLIVSDILMPGMDGYALCKEVKSDEHFKDIPVILLTSLSGPEDVIKGLECGADNFIRKPFDEKYLLSRIDYIIANRDLRKSEKLQMGVELYLGGKRHFITAERQQILDLLISTYEQAVRLNEDLKTREREVARANRILKGLYQIAKELNQAASEGEMLELVLNRALELPELRAGWIVLFDERSGFHVATVRGLPEDLNIPSSLEADCLCRRKFLAGELERATLVSECERFAAMGEKASGLRSHVTIPLRVASRGIGILNLIMTRRVPLTDDDLRTLNGIGNQIGAALERLRMQEHLEQLVEARTVALTAEIAERKLAQQRLEDERNLLRTIIEAIPDEIAVKDIERRFVLVNPACVRALKKESAEEVVGKRDEDLIPEEHALDGRLEDERILATGKGFVNNEGKTRINPKTGAIERSILISKIPLSDRDGKITGLVVVNRDITERKRAEVEIQRSRDWLNAILDASRDGLVAEKNEIIVYANAPYAHIYGYDDPAELIGKHVSTVQSELDNTRMLQFGRRRLEGERMPEVYEFKGRKKDGRFIDLEASVSTASIAGEEHIVATIRDITERKSLQKQLIEAQKMESIGTLAGGIAHDFNNILGIIMGHASILEQMRPDPEKFLQSIQAINKATYRGASLVRQLLTFARKTDVTMQSVLINDILNELAKLLEETLPKTIVMELNLEKKLPSILADPTQLHQVFLNLCVNARDAMMPKGGRVSIATRLVWGESVLAKFDRAGAMEYIVIDVADTGMGMDEATRRRIFEPFFTTKEKGKGTGLGLATVYGIVESHGGFIDVESRVGAGSTFHVYLPVEPRQVKRGELEKVAEKELPGGTETILVVEDEETLRDLISFVLEGKGYRVLTASDGEEGLRLFTEHMQDIALVLSDLGLPKISGEDLLKRVRQLKPGARVILASGYVEPGTKSELLKAGAVEIVQKPYVPVEILKKIREALDSAV